MSAEVILDRQQKLITWLAAHADILNGAVGASSQWEIDTIDSLKEALLRLDDENRLMDIGIVGRVKAGKSTLLNLIAGLTLPTTGVLLLEDREIGGPGPERAVVFQNHSLLPWLSCYENVELAVRQVFKHSKSRPEMREWIEHNLNLVNMMHAKDKRPSEISGGMKQRVGIARALAMEPKVLLLDEPFGALDALTRAHLQDSVMALHQKLGNTILMITHDVDEAVLLSDRIVMMTNGPAARIGEVLEVPLARPRKRLELARALATRPRTLLLDEIAGGLTDAECHELVETIRTIHAEGVAIIWIEHVVHALLAVVQRLVVLNFGKVVAQGVPAEVMRSREVETIYMGVPA